LDVDSLKESLTQKSNLDAELADFWAGMPHRELHGRSRSMVTFSPEMFPMLDELRVAARHDVTVLMIGETGSGKTFTARLIHELSDRREHQFCTVACGALPPDLIESELFGHVKGAFTSADRDRQGKFAAAGKGTLLLDEIDVLPLEQQAKLLRVIETGEYEPVGSNETRKSEARLIVASNYNLEDLVRNGTFRTDLYYRLNILHFRVPPLRERPLDVEYLARKFAIEHSRDHGVTLREIQPEFLEALKRYQWPGNVRELENVLRRAVLYCQRGVLSVQDLPSAVRSPGAEMRPGIGVGNGGFAGSGQQPGPPAGHHYGAGPPHGPAAAAMGHASPHPGHAHAHGQPAPAYDPLAAGYAVATAAPPQAQQGRTEAAGRGDARAQSIPLKPATLEARVDVVERTIIEDCLRRNNHRRKETAAELGISRVTLYNKMKKFGLLN